MRQSDELAIRIHLRKSDLFYSVLSYYERRPIFWLMPLMCGLVAYPSLARYELGWMVAIVTGVCAFPVLPLLMFRSAVKNPSILFPITYLFSSYGIGTEFENGSSAAAWALVRGASETGQYFFIHVYRGFHLVPVKQVTEEQKSRLRQMLRDHVPSKNLRVRRP